MRSTPDNPLATFAFDGKLLAGRIRSRTALRLIEEWATLHRDELAANCERVEAGEPLEGIEPLESEQYFQRFYLDGGTVAWPNGTDIAPETLHATAQDRQAA